MTTISQTAGQNLKQHSSGGFLRPIVQGAQALFDYLERRAAIKTLHQLDDRALRDIGVSRCQIEAAVNGNLKSELTRYL